MQRAVMAIHHVHLVGIGGINMSAVAKLLQHAGISVSGSDLASSLMTDELVARGIPVAIGHKPSNIPSDTDLVIYTSAAQDTNPERQEARRRNIRQLTNFQFLGEWTADQQTVLVTGTHGKSTTTAMLAEMLVRGGKDPSVVVGSKVPSFVEGNVRLGSGELFLIEGDEYARHFLEFHPSAVIINNIELDHTDIFPNLRSLIEAFRELLRQVRNGGLVVANADDPRVQTLIGEERAQLEARRISIVTFGFGAHADVNVIDYTSRPGEQMFVMRDPRGAIVRLSLHVPGKMNVMNAVAAATLAVRLEVRPERIRESLAAYAGIWRRFEKIAEKNGILVVSDYGHHPTAVQANLDASKAFYPDRRLVLCFQPHHRNRTKALFQDFIPSFDRADVLLFVEIFDVAGRDDATDQDISSRDLQETILNRDAKRRVNRPVEYAATPEEALKLLRRWKKPNDLILVMGAGDIYKIADKIVD
ncbi:MAG: UDP-N-acetylmuramate--L-alanine ligase [Patescibacteria group bacterium]